MCYKVTGSFPDGNEEIIATVSYDPFTDKVEEVLQVMTINHATRKRFIRSTDSAWGRCVKHFNWTKLYMIEMEAAWAAKEQAEINEQAEQEALLAEHYRNQERAMILHDQMQGHAVTVYDHFQMGLI